MSQSPQRQLQAGQPPGEQHARSRLTEEKVRDIHARVTAGEACTVVALAFDVSARTVEEISKGRSWKHLNLPPVPTKQGSRKPGSKLTEADIPKVHRRIQEGYSIGRVARDFGVSRTCIADIWHGRTWKHVPRPVSRVRAWE